MESRWPHIVQVGLFIAAGIGCLVLGQIPVGTALIGAAIGNALPTSMLIRKNGAGFQPPEEK